ncbi:MAG: EamA family transporter, partial [Succiniclasticum sp.]
MKNKKMLGNLLLLLTAMIWGTAFVGQRVGMDSIEPITFNAARMALAAVMVGTLAYALRKKHKGDVARQAVSGTTVSVSTENALPEADASTEHWHNTVRGGICCG